MVEFGESLGLFEKNCGGYIKLIVIIIKKSVSPTYFVSLSMTFHNDMTYVIFSGSGG